MGPCILHTCCISARTGGSKSMDQVFGLAALVAALLVAPTIDLEQAREAMEAQQWRRAVAILSDHLEDAPGDLEAHYLRGICYGEIGKTPNLRNRLERVLQKGAADFDTVLTSDSLYRDTIFQLALIRRYDNMFQEAIRLAETQIQLRPEIAHVHLGLLNFYWRYMVSKPPAEARRWLRTLPGPYARLFVARTYESQSLFQPAELIYQELRREGFLPVPVLVALARLKFQEQKPIAGTWYMKEAIEAIETELDALLLFDEIRTIVSPGEHAAFERRASLSEAKAFFAEFWARRDPMPAAPYNARMVEHYRRLRIAETHYVFNGFRSWFRSRFTHDERYLPPTYTLGGDFDDRGVMFIRHGEPDDFSVGESPTWLFEASAEDGDSLLIFHFAPTCHGGICGVTKHFVPVPRGESFLPPRLVGLDAADMERKTLEYITRGLSTDRHRWPSGTKELDVPVMPASFRGMDGRTLVEVFYEVPVQELEASQDTIVFETGFMVQDMRWRQHTFNRNVIRLPQATADQSYDGLFQVDLLPQPYRTALHVRSLSGRAVSTFRQRYVPLDFSAPGLKLSDILLADSVLAIEGDPAARREDVHVQVRPSGTFSRTETPAVYYEIYDLAEGPDQRTLYAISYALKDRRGDVTTLSTGESGGALRSPVQFVVIDVADLARGTYTLTVTVEDRIAGTRASQSRQLTLIR